MGSNSYFAMLIGEKHQSLIPNFGRVGIQGIIYDNSGGPSGHCITTPYNNNDWVAWHNSYNGHTATENAVNGNCLFKDDYW